MSDQADLDEDRAIFDYAPPFMLPPETPEAILLLLVISVCLTITFHAASLTHIFGILLLVLVAKLNSMTFNPQTLGFLAKVHCLREATQNCRQIAQAHLKDVSGQALAWISGVAPEEKVLDIQTGAFTEAGHQFQCRAGVIGALVTFVLVYKVVCAVYIKAYSTARTSASIAELDVKPASGQSTLRKGDSATSNRSDPDASKRNNPLISPEGIGKEITPTTHENPLRVPEVKELEKSACCTACETLETAQVDWIEAVRQYGEASETVLEENTGLKEQVMRLQQQISGLREEMKTQEDRIEYLDVLLEEAGKQLGHEADVKDMLWDGYCKRQEFFVTYGRSDAAITANPLQYVEQDKAKSAKLVEESLLREG